MIPDSYSDLELRLGEIEHTGPIVNLENSSAETVISDYFHCSSLSFHIQSIIRAGIYCLSTVGEIRYRDLSGLPYKLKRCTTYLSSTTLNGVEVS